MRYSAENKKVQQEIQQIYNKFAKIYGETQKKDIPEDEKQVLIMIGYQMAKEMEGILLNVQSLSQLSDEERSLLGIEENEPKVDTNIVDTLVSIYAKRAKMPKENLSGTDILKGITLPKNEEFEDIDTTDFEEELRQYFTEHYLDLFDTGYNDFLSEIAENKNDSPYEKNGDLIEMAIKHNLDPKKFNCFGYKLTIQDGLVAEEDSTFGETNIFYSTPEGINKKIFELYSKTLFQEYVSGANYFSNENRKLKNTYITYAEKNGIEITDKDALEEIPVDMDKVKGIAKYVNRVLNEEEKIDTDLTEDITKEIQENYSKIMNLNSFNFSKLETVKKISNDIYSSSLHLSINEDSILYTDEISPDIAYGTPEYVKEEYSRIMDEVKRLHHTDAFKDGYLNVEKINKKKEALRRYITENEIEEIDISIPDVEIDHQRTEMIADGIMNLYGEKYEDKEGMKARILQKIEDQYPEMFYERQVIDLEDLIGEELKEMENGYVDESLYMQKDFVCISDYMGSTVSCLYTTPEALQDKIASLDEKISTNDFCFEEKNIREKLVNYAKENDLEIQVPDLESIEKRRQQERDMFSFRGNGWSLLDRDILPDDPTARPKIELEDSVSDVIIKMSEGLPGTIRALAELVQSDEAGAMLLLGLDDMNIRGSQVWIGYKDLYHEDGAKFLKAVKNRDSKMVDFINQEIAVVGGEKAVTGGASFDRNKNPNKYRFTEEEVKELKEQREERIIKQQESREKMLANSPLKKKKPAQKRREERDAKKKAYRERLIANGKKSISELDDELTKLKDKEQQAKDLYNEYNQQLDNKTKESGEIK